MVKGTRSSAHGFLRTLLKLSVQKVIVMFAFKENVIGTKLHFNYTGLFYARWVNIFIKQHIRTQHSQLLYEIAYFYSSTPAFFWKVIDKS